MLSSAAVIFIFRCLSDSFGTCHSFKNILSLNIFLNFFLAFQRSKFRRRRSKTKFQEFGFGNEVENNGNRGGVKFEVNFFNRADKFKFVGSVVQENKSEDEKEF